MKAAAFFFAMLTALISAALGFFVIAVARSYGVRLDAISYVFFVGLPSLSLIGAIVSTRFPLFAVVILLLCSIGWVWFGTRFGSSIDSFALLYAALNCISACLAYMYWCKKSESNLQQGE